MTSLPSNPGHFFLGSVISEKYREWLILLVETWGMIINGTTHAPQVFYKVKFMISNTPTCTKNSSTKHPLKPLGDTYQTYTDLFLFLSIIGLISASLYFPRKHIHSILYWGSFLYFQPPQLNYYSRRTLYTILLLHLGQSYCLYPSVCPSH